MTHSWALRAYVTTEPGVVELGRETERPHRMDQQLDKPESHETYEAFLHVFAQDRERILAFIFSLVPRHADAEDIFQKCSLILWRKFGEFQREQSFLAWACGIAKLEVRNYLRTSARDRLYFDEELMQQLATHRARSLSEYDDRLTALRHCLKRLTGEERELIDTVYGSDRTIKELALATGGAVQTLYNRLGRLRRRLLECVQNKLATSS